MAGPLFGGPAGPTKRAKAPQTPPGVIHGLIQAYVAAYTAKFAEPPVIYKRDGPLLAQLVRQFGAGKVEERFRAYLAWDDPYIIETGYSIDGFHRQWNRLAARVALQRPAASRDGAETTDQYLKRMKGA